MTDNNAMVRDYSRSPANTAVAVAHGTAFEALLTLMAAGEDKLDEDVDHALAKAVRDRLPETVLGAVDRLGSSVWLGLTGLAYDLPAPRSLGDLVDMLRAQDPIQVRRAMVAQLGHGKGAEWLTMIDAAATGDAEALDGALAECPVGDIEPLREFFSLDPVESVSLLTDALEGMADAMGDLESLEETLQRDASARRAMAASMAPDRLVELTTNGIAFESQPREGTVLVPTVVMRPWVVITSHRGRRMVFYPVDEQHLVDTGSGTVPGWLVDVHRALGDERRLQALALLASGPRGLGQVAEHLGVSKSTAHHHLRILRAAGLVRITVGNEKAYAARPGALEEAARGLAAYLTPVNEDTMEGVSS